MYEKNEYELLKEYIYNSAFEMFKIFGSLFPQME